MKIIKEGNKKFDLESKTFQCRECDCTFEMKQGEYHIHNDYNGRKTDYITVCPYCGYMVIESKYATQISINNLLSTATTISKDLNTSKK